MSFFSFIKKSSRTLDAFTYNSAAYELFPISPVQDHIPKWWKNIPPTVNQSTPHGLEFPMSTIRTCVGIRDLYTKGFIIPLWSDLILETSNDGSWRNQFSDGFTESSYHSREQIGSVMDNWIHIKFMTPWLIKDKKGTQLVWQQPLWNHYPSADFHVPPGIINYKNLTATNVQMFFPKTNNRYVYDAGLPLVHLIPCVENVNINIKTHLVTKEEYDKIQNTSFNINWTFNNKFQKAKKILDNKKSTCPFKTSNKDA